MVVASASSIGAWQIMIIVVTSASQNALPR
jgi:hypothetical protein